MTFQSAETKRGNILEHIFFLITTAALSQHIMGDTEKKLIVCLYSMDFHTPEVSLSLALFLKSDEKEFLL